MGHYYFSFTLILFLQIEIKISKKFNDVTKYDDKFWAYKRTK